MMPAAATAIAANDPAAPVAIAAPPLDFAVPEAVFEPLAVGVGLFKTSVELCVPVAEDPVPVALWLLLVGLATLTLATCLHTVAK